jgi:tetratricopeptide (TPR) repeat protein
MSVETIRMALGRLQDEPENEAAWNELAEAVTAPNNGAGAGDVERLLGAARARHEQRHEWQAVARLLELEIALAAGSPVEGAMQAELARVYHEELIDVDRATAAYKRLLELRPDDDAAAETLETDASKRERWRDLVDRYVAEAEAATDGAFKSALYTSAADIGYRYGRAELGDKVAELVDLALKLDPKNRRAANLAEIAFAAAGDWDAVVRVQSLVKAEAQLKEDRIAAGLRAARTIKTRLGDPAR